MTKQRHEGIMLMLAARAAVALVLSVGMFVLAPPYAVVPDQPKLVERRN